MSLNSHIQEDELKLRDADFGLFVTSDAMAHSAGQLKSLLEKIQRPIIQVRIDDIDKVDRQIHYDKKYVALWDKTSLGTINA